MRQLNIIVACLLLTTSALAQSPAEKKQYEKIIKKPTVTAIDNFLKKYPNSVYSQEVSARRDTLLSITPYTNEDAKEIMNQFILEGEYISFPIRENGIDFIYSIEAKDNNYIFYTAQLEIKGKKTSWKVLEKETFSSNIEDASCLENSSLKGQIETIRDTKYLIADFLFEKNESEELVIGAKEKYVYLSYCPSSHQFAELVFSGIVIFDAGEKKIEGVSNKETYGQARTDVGVLSYKMDNNPLLKRIPSDILLSDLAIEDWLKGNPDALTRARKIAMLFLPEEASLSGLFESSKKVSSSRYSAAIIDVRGWTVVVVKSKSSGDYLLCWVEEECKDHKNDRLLNSLSFSDDSTLKMSYYHGKKTFSYYLNITSKTLKR